MIALMLLGCAPPEEACGEATDSRVALITTLNFARQLKPGISRGFDLDGAEGTCDRDDLRHPDGSP